MNIKAISRMLVAVVLTCAIIIAGVGGYAYYTYYLSAPSGAKTLEILCTFDLTPPGLYQYGKDCKDSVQLYADMINAEGGVLGMNISFIWEDPSGQPEKMIAIFEKHKDDSKNIAWLGPVLSTEAIPIWQRMQDKGNVWFPQVWADVIRQNRSTNAFFTMPFASLIGELDADFVRDLGFRNWVCVMQDDAAMLNKWKTQKLFLQAHGVNIMKEFVLSKDTMDFTQYLFEIKQLPVKPDIVGIGWATLPNAWVLVNQAVEMGLCGNGTGVPWLEMGAEAWDDGFWEATGYNSVWSLKTLSEHANATWAPLGQKLIKLWNEKIGRVVGTGCMPVWDAIIAYISAVRFAGTTEPNAVIHALETNQFVGSRGVMDFSPGPVADPTNLHHHQMDIPFFGVQLTALNQRITETAIIWPPSMVTAPYHIP